MCCACIFIKICDILYYVIIVYNNSDFILKYYHKTEDLHCPIVNYHSSLKLSFYLYHIFLSNCFFLLYMNNIWDDILLKVSVCNFLAH